MSRLTWLKSLLWAAFGAGVAAIALRLVAGLGATTHLSNFVSWGIWNAVKISIVPLSAGAFVMAATVYIFGFKRFHSLLRLCILTGFLGYSTFATMLLFDIGLPYRIWHPMIFWQHHSVLFEVAMCVMAYLTVLALEFAPTALEHELFSRPIFRRIFKTLKAVTIPLVIAGIVLSTLHQSSLGSLFLIVPHRLHPLWYSPLIHLLFFLSAIGMGFLVVSVLAFFLEYFLREKAPSEILAPLARVGAGFMLLFAAVRLLDQVFRGVPASATDGMTYLYLLEIMLATVIPALLFLRRVRHSRPGLFVCALSAMLGVVLYRSDVALFAINWGGASYFPAWTELLIMVGIPAGAVLVFLFIVEDLDIYGSKEELRKRLKAENAVATIGPDSSAWLGSTWTPSAKRYSLIFVAAASVALGLVGNQVISADQLDGSPVSRARTVQGLSAERPAGLGHDFALAQLANPVSTGSQPVTLLMIDGNRDGRLVLFPHDNHVKKLGEEDSCVTCHHQNMPFDRNTSCHECHSDMYDTTDIFDHAFHVDKLDGNRGCVRCHAEDSAVKARATATACVECHAGMLVSGSRVEVPDGGTTGFAPGYMDVLHKLCIGCHQEKRDKEPDRFDAAFGRCDGCHGIMDGSDLEALEPYVETPSLSIARTN